MESGEGKVLAGARDALGPTRALREREQPSRTALEVIRAAQARVRKAEAGPRDYALIIAAHRLASWEEPASGRGRAVTRRDLLRPVDPAALQDEAKRVESDPAFRCLIRSESQQNLRLNALRINGLAMTQYAGRAAELRRREAEPQRREAEQERSRGAERSRTAAAEPGYPSLAAEPDGPSL